MFLGIDFTNWNVMENYFRMNFLSILSAKNDLLSLLCRVRSLFKLLAVLSGTLTVDIRDVSSANNLGLHWRLSDKSLMYFRNKSGTNIELWGTKSLILAQDELWPSRTTLCFLFLKKSVKRFNKFPEIPLRLRLWIIFPRATLYLKLSKCQGIPL